jgi:hypothetical protein
MRITDNHWQSTGNQSNLRNQKFSFSPFGFRFHPHENHIEHDMRWWILVNYLIGNDLFY